MSSEELFYYPNHSGMIQMRSIVDGIDLRYAFSLPDSRASLPPVGGRLVATDYQP
jgi:hypothetical protein